MNYFSLYLKFFSINIKSLMSYKIDFIFGIVSMLLKQAMSFIIVIFILSLTDQIKGWFLYQLLFMYGFSLTAIGLWHCFFINTISIPYYIQNGQYDRFMTKPLNIIFQIITDSFDEDGWGELLLGIITLIISIIHLKILSYYLLLLPILIIFSSLILAAITLSVSSLSFLTISESSIVSIIIRTFDFAKYPLNIYNNIIIILFSTIIPLGFISYYPSLLFLYNNGQGVVYALISPLVSLIFFFMACIIFNFLSKSYSSSGN